MGRIMITMSLAICIAALEYQTGPLGRQWALWLVLSRLQKKLIGTQNTKPLITIHRPAIMRQVIVMRVAMMNQRPRKMRRKRNKAESLARTRARL